jgi:hypothetical protein
MIHVSSVTRDIHGRVYEAVLAWGNVLCTFRVPGRICMRQSRHQRLDKDSLDIPKLVYDEMIRYSYGIFRPKTPGAPKDRQLELDLALKVAVRNGK